MTRIKKMDRQHWPAVSAIYRQGIATGLATFERNVPAWEEWNAKHLESCRLVAVQKDKVVAWAALSPVSQRSVYSGVAEVSVYVERSMRGRGVGRQLLTELIQAAEQAGIWTLQAGIFPENEASLRLHAQAGFRKVGIREKIGRLNGQWRDVLLLERRSKTVGL